MFSGRILEKDICNISDYQHKEEKNHKDYTSCLSSYNILVVQHLSFFVKAPKELSMHKSFFGIFFWHKNTGGTVNIRARSIKIVKIKYQFFVKLQSNKK